jgi:glutamyl-tRNA reductase
MNLVAVGLNHRTAPVEVREKVSFPEAVIGEALEALLANYAVNEAAIISTCNRVELMAVVSEAEKGVWEVKRFISEYHGIPLETLDEHLYTHTAEDAVRHLFRVASGLDSLVMGEPQILGQIKDAYSFSVHNNAAGAVVNKLFHKAFSVAKRIRTETRIGASAVSISYAAVELAKKIFGVLANKSVMLIGAGEMAELAARHLKSAGVKEILITNRTYEKAVELARSFAGTSIMFGEFLHHLKHTDIVIASTASPTFIIKPEHLADVMKERKNSPMFFIDISVPRNIDPLVNTVQNAYVYDVDDLKGVVEANIKERTKEAEEAERIVDEEIGAFYRWVSSIDVLPTIVALQRRLEEIRKGELEKALGALPGITEKERSTLDALTKAIIKKILHQPLVLIKKESSSVRGDALIEAVRLLFDLELEKAAKKTPAEKN